MSITRQFLTVLALSCSLASAATVSFSSGGSFTLFQTSSGSPLTNGYLHAGYYTANPIGLSAEDLRDSFSAWATFGNDSGESGFFGNSDFPVTDVGGAAGRPIYLAVTDTEDVSAANQIAVFTNTSDSDWNFPSNDLGFNPSITLDDIIGGADGSSVLAGAITTSNLTGTNPAIELAAVPEPSVLSLLGMLALGALARRRR